MKELKKALDDARPHCNPRAIVIINPGNPTGKNLARPIALLLVSIPDIGRWQEWNYNHAAHI